MEDKELITNALNYYDKNYEKKKKIFKDVKYYSHIISENDLEHSVIIFYDINKKELFRSRYEFLSVFLEKANIWVWSWAMPTIKKNQIRLSKKVLNYGLDLAGESMYLLRLLLTTSRLRIDNHILLDVCIALAAYISKSAVILRVAYDEKGPIIENDIMYLPFSQDLKDTTISYSYYSLLDV